MGVGFGLYISRLSQKENDNFGVRKDLRDRLNELLRKVIKDLSTMAQEIAKKEKRVLIRDDDYHAVIQEYFTEGPLERVIKKEALRSVGCDGNDLILPMSRIRRCFNGKFTLRGLAYLGGVLEQVLIEIFDSVITVSKKRGNKSMTLKDLWRGIRDDEELSRLFSQ